MPGTVSRKKPKKARNWNDDVNKSAETVEKSSDSETEEDEPVDRPANQNDPAEDQNKQLEDRNELVDLIPGKLKEKKSKKTRARKHKEKM